MKQLKKPNTAREYAVTILAQACIKIPIQHLLNNLLITSTFSKQDTALITELVYGYLRSEMRISWLLNQFLKKPQKLPTLMHTILGVAVYEILYLNKIPHYASIHSAVQTIHNLFGKQLAQVANGTLRTILRQLEGKDPPTQSSFYQNRLPDYINYLSIFYSIPLWIIDLWIKAYGEQKTLALAINSASTPHTCVRINTHQKGWETVYSDFCKSDGVKIGTSGICFKQKPQPSMLKEYIKQGALSLQGAGSQEVLAILDIYKLEMPIWDACAGRGGKTLALLELGLPVIAASDISFQKIQALKSESIRLGLPSPALFCASATQPLFHISNTLHKQPRTIVLDVPCSNLGTLARHPDIRKLRKKEDLTQLVQLQKKIIDTAWSQLPSGGHLVYITCTMNPMENEQQVLYLLKKHKNACLEKQWESTPNHISSDLMFGAVIKKTPT